jgi:hypothetical protein
MTNYTITLSDGSTVAVEAAGVHHDSGALILDTDAGPVVFAPRTWVRAEPQTARITRKPPPPTPEWPAESSTLRRGFA